MRILLVTLHDVLPFAITKVLNPANEYCAIVTDEIESVRNFLPGAKNIIHQFYELKECLENFHYDCVISIQDVKNYEAITKCFKYCKLPANKLVTVGSINLPDNFLLRETLLYYEKHASEFKIFSTGMSYTSYGLNFYQFKSGMINFGYASQDLYYDYQIAKHIITPEGGALRYALIGLAPYSFHYDLSKTFSAGIFKYFVALNDLHNFWLPIEKYQNLFRAEYLSLRLQTGDSDMRRIYFESNGKAMNFEDRINARENIDMWKDKNYPETLAENIKILDDYLTLCEKNKIRPIIFLPPMSDIYKECFSKNKLDEFYCIVRNAQKKTPFNYFY